MTTTPERALYRAEQLRPLLEPRSIAIMGASERPGSFGLRTLESLRGQGCRVYPVNPKYEHIAGERCYPSLAALPETPECAVIAVPREGVEALVRQCADAGVGGAIVYASGYAETRKAGHLELQSRLTAIARASGMPILGPNCIGIVTGGGALRITFAETPDMRTLRAGAIGIVSQSGGLGLALAQASAHGYAFSHMLTTGNACDVDVADEIAYLAEQPACAVIACVFEGMSDPRRLIDAGRLAIARGKPVVICKLATGVEGAEAAKSHTGMLAGSSAAYRAAFERAGFAVVEQFEALIETAAFFAKAGRPTSDGIAALATSGGASIMVADSAEAHGVRLPQPNDEVRRYLESQIPEFGSARNPCDVTAQILNDPGALPACADKLLACAEFSTLIIPHPYAYAPATRRLEALGAVAARHGKVICSVWLSQWLDGPGTRELEANPDVALFRSMDRCMAALKAWHGLAQAPAEGADADVADELAAGSRERAAAMLGEATAEVLTERQAKAILALYGVPVVEEVLVDSPDAAHRAARRIGYPVVAKVESPDIPHKTEAGVVCLDLGDEAQLRQAWDEVMANAARHAPGARINGVLIQRMVPQGLELIVGARHDPGFGPLVVVGFGGVLVELLADTAVGLAPISSAEARALLQRLKGYPLLAGFRGKAPADLARLAGIISRVSQMVSDHRDVIDELDINPLIVDGGDIVAVDALITKRAATAGFEGS